MPDVLRRLINGCFGLLAGAVALYIAVQLVEAIVVPLIVIGAVALVVAAVVVVARRDGRGGW